MTPERSEHDDNESGDFTDSDAGVRDSRSLSYRNLIIYLVFAWGVEDTLSTLIAASSKGSSLEGNPIIRQTLETDPIFTVFLKLGVAVFAGVMALWAERFVQSVPFWRFWLLELILLGVIVTSLNLAIAFA